MNNFLLKLSLDKYYENYFKNSGCKKNDLYRLGFFKSDYTDLNDLHSDFKLNLYSTYLFDESLFCKDRTNYILVTSGGFSPIHEGHLSMMKKAKEYFVSMGKNVIGGYISPSHDDYVSSKRNGEAHLNIWKRIDIVENMIKDIDWLFIDKWEGTECRYAINYTVLIERLEKYYNFHYSDYDIEIVFVYGSDNNSFSQVLEFNKKYNICVNRNNEYAHQESKEYTYYYKEDALNVSSKYLRESSKFKEKDYNEVSGFYDVRNDYLHSMEYLNSKISKNRLHQFSKNFINLLNNSISKNLKINVIDVDKQLNVTKDFLELKLNELKNNINGDLTIINLDCYLKSDDYFNLGISRLFNICDGQIRSNKLVRRNSKMELNLKIDELTADKFIIIDDDIASGFTINNVKKLLPVGSEVLNVYGMNDLCRDYNNEECFDVIDIRDFIIGSKNGGLLVDSKKGCNIRVPYIKPYVNLISRANLIPEHIDNFSFEVLKLNLELYRNSNILLGDLDEFNKNLFLIEGYKELDLVENILKDKLSFYFLGK